MFLVIRDLPYADYYRCYKKPLRIMLIYIFFCILAIRQWRFFAMFDTNSGQPSDQGHSHGQVQGRGPRTSALGSRTSAFELEIESSTKLPVAVGLVGVDHRCCRDCPAADAARQRAQQPHRLHPVKPFEQRRRSRIFRKIDRLQFSFKCKQVFNIEDL